MLAVSSYPPEYVKQCRANIDDLLKAYKKVAAAAKGDASVTKFAPLLCNHLVLALDEYFVHRLRNVEGKDGNPCNEVRVLADVVDGARRHPHRREVDQIEPGDVGARTRAR